MRLRRHSQRTRHPAGLPALQKGLYPGFARGSLHGFQRGNVRGLLPVPWRVIMKSERIMLDHGSGGKISHQLVTRTLVPTFDNEILARLDDGAGFQRGRKSYRLFHRHLRGGPHIFPRRMHRRPGGERHRERPRHVRRKAPLLERGADHRRRVPHGRPGENSSGDEQGCHKGGCEDRDRRTPKSSPGARPTRSSSTPPGSALLPKAFIFPVPTRAPET